MGFAWAGFGSAFGPVVILSLFWRKLTNTGAITAMIVGAVTVFVWQYTPWSDLYEIIPGFFLGMLAAIVGSLATYKRDPEIEAEFDQAVRLANDSHQAPTEAAASSRVESDVAAGRN